MKPSFQIAVAALTLLGAVVSSQALAADNLLHQHALTLQEKQQSQQFSVGDNVYQMVPDAMLVPGEQAQDAANGPAVRSASSNTATAISRIGPYAIVLSSDPNANRTFNRRASTASSSGREVAVNMQTGQPVLVLPQLQLQVKEAGHGEALARSLGGKLLFDGSSSLMVVVGFDSVAAALQALPQATAMDNVNHAQPGLKRRFIKLR